MICKTPAILRIWHNLFPRGSQFALQTKFCVEAGTSMCSGGWIWVGQVWTHPGRQSLPFAAGRSQGCSHAALMTTPRAARCSAHSTAASPDLVGEFSSQLQTPTFHERITVWYFQIFKKISIELLKALLYNAVRYQDFKHSQYFRK